MSTVLSTQGLDALPIGTRVMRGRLRWEKTDPPGPNGPWRRPAEGVDVGKWITTNSSALCMIGVTVADD